MRKRHVPIAWRILAIITVLFWGAGEDRAQSQSSAPTQGSHDRQAVIERMMKRVTPQQRQKAAAWKAAQRAKSDRPLDNMPKPGGTPNYFGPDPNYANSPILKKFVDSLPGLNTPNNLGQMLPVAVPDTITYPGSDYYEIAVKEYTEKMHSQLPATRLRGYVQLNYGTGSDGKNSVAPATIHYLGPIIVGQQDRPVRLKFTNLLPTGSGGNLFLPADTTVMGAGMGPTGGMYAQNRATLHLHGGNTPWISDGTPHQWTVPAGEATPYKKGVSTQNVPDMWFDASGKPVPAGTPGATNDPGPGSMTFYYTNQQSGRLMFYHDHSYGITRLNVYAGEAAGYVLTDPTEQILVNGGSINGFAVSPGTVPSAQIPLIIQDKTFVDPDNIQKQDPTWNWGGAGQLWFPHVYMTNQDPYNPIGANDFGRWDYGPWFWPPVTTLAHGQVVLPDGTSIPGTPNPTLVPEAFMDTPLINGTAYPYTIVQRKAYRLRILNACNDRTLNLQLYYADPSYGTSFRAGGAGFPGYGTEVRMLPAVPNPNFPATWPTDGRDGGVPDPALAGPPLIQIGTEGGFLNAPAVIESTPIGYEYNRRSITVLNVSSHALMLGPAERADVIVDFSKVPAGARLILYNDAPAPTPAFDSRYDYYTGDPDQTSTGGAPPTLPGYGPNTRTILQFRVEGAAASEFDLGALAAALPRAFNASQPYMIVPPNTYAGIHDTSMTWIPPGQTKSITIPLTNKTIQELFELEYGRMNAILGTELPFTNFNNQTTIPLGYIDPPTEMISDGQTQLWKITHNGVDTHAIHFHLFNVQLVNRVGWDGQIKPPDANELGWKETVRMNPLEDVVVAIRPVQPTLPFKLPDSIRLLDVTSPEGSTKGFYGIDPYTGAPIAVSNVMTNFGWEYVWHCHILGHEENDMMRAIIFQVAPSAPRNVTAISGGSGQAIVMFDPPATIGGSPVGVYTVTSSPDNIKATGSGTRIVVPGLTSGKSYTFTVKAGNGAGTGPASAPSNAVMIGAPAPTPDSMSGPASISLGPPPGAGPEPAARGREFPFDDAVAASGEGRRVR